jgi:hypothetical protein
MIQGFAFYEWMHKVTCSQLSLGGFSAIKLKGRKKKQ